jgi:hypothetical protein
MPRVFSSFCTLSLLSCTIALGACVPAARSAAALPPIETDRPDLTESAATVPARTIQLEGGYTLTRTPDATGLIARDQSIGEGLLRIALSSKVEGRVGFNSYVVHRDGAETLRGLEDASLGTKIRIIETGDAPSLLPTTSVIVATSLPTGNRAMSAKVWLPEAKLATAWTFSERVGLGTNLIASAQRDATQRYTQLGASASLGVDVTDRVGTYFEWFGFRDQLRGAVARNSLNGGLTFAINDALQLDARYGGAINGAGRDHFFGVGIARRWSR